MSWVAGADGCRAGWFVVLRRLHSNGQRFCDPLTHISQALDLPEQPSVVAVDIPIGLLTKAQTGGRHCDRRARKLLRQPRARSVFSPPVRSALIQNSYPLALAENRKSSAELVGISKQCYGLFPKLRQVDDWMNHRKQERVREVHPELCFFQLNGRNPMRYSKQDIHGFNERMRLLSNAGFGGLIEKAMARFHRSEVARDDILDACVACWTAERILKGKACRIPEQPAFDAEGLRMEILF